VVLISACLVNPKGKEKRRSENRKMDHVVLSGKKGYSPKSPPLYIYQLP
jgi:hypothetical protein